MNRIFRNMLLLSLLVLGGRFVHAQSVVANAGVKASDISTDELRSIFTGATTHFKDGSHAAPVTLKSGSVHEAFLSQYIGKNDSAFKATWRGLVFSGQATMPKSFDSEADLLEYVAKTPGAIGYAAKGAKHDGVKTLQVK